MPVIAFGRQRGLGLVELLVGIVISLIVMAGTIFVFIGNSESSLLFMRTTRSSELMRDSMDRMVHDIRRAGYLGWRYMADASVTLEPDGNMFNRYVSDDVDSSTTLLGTDCDDGLCSTITYAYNRDDDGTTDADPPRIGRGIDPGCAGAEFDDGRLEWFGFRFRNGAIEMLQTRSDDCTNPGDEDWQAITDPNLVTIADIGNLREDRVGFEVLEECVGIIDVTGPGGVPDGDAFGEADGVDGLTCQDLCDAAVLDEGDFVVRGQQVRIQLAGRSTSADGATSAVQFRLSQVVDLPNYPVRVVPAGGFVCP